jgi:ATP-binding cassette, subfamily C, bacterial exporter for protease/lipase
VVMAAKRAGVHEMILYFPKGYDTPLGDGGAGLSGGQKQRLGLARAMYDDPSFIVLDEPNSNLDEVGEQALIAAVNDLRQRGKTIVMITHRASTLAVTNKLLVLKDGVSQMFGLTREVLENLSKLNQQQIKQAQQPPAQASNGAVVNGTVLDANNGADNNAKDVEQVEDVGASKASLKPAPAGKKNKANNKAKQAVTE